MPDATGYIFNILLYDKKVDKKTKFELACLPLWPLFVSTFVAEAAIDF